jgi:hypothetical protein
MRDRILMWCKMGGYGYAYGGGDGYTGGVASKANI